MHSDKHSSHYSFVQLSPASPPCQQFQRKPTCGLIAHFLPQAVKGGGLLSWHHVGDIGDQ